MSLPSQAPKRLRLAFSQRPWVCHSCQQRTFASYPPRSQQASQQDEKTTHFGFESVAESAKAGRVGAVFSSVASSYDTMNDLMSVGVHRLWKDHFVRSLNPGIPGPTASKEPQRVLDIAGGTGDIALRILDHASKINHDETLELTISDINAAMLAEGRKRLGADENGKRYVDAGRVSFLEANAEDLHTVQSNSVDLYTVAFGIRNFTHKEKALREAYRVLKPGGVFACLEFAPQLSNRLLNALYKRWSFSAIPLIGQIVAADRDSYQYLVESIERFPSQHAFAAMIRDAGFLLPGQTPEEVRESIVPEAAWEDLSLGIAAIHKGVKPA